jgi:hypothetical protein
MGSSRVRSFIAAQEEVAMEVGELYFRYVAGNGMGDLSDSYEDCVKRVRGYPDEYLFKGEGVTVTLNTASPSSNTTIEGKVTEALSDQGYYDIRIKSDVGYTSGSIRVFARTPMDRGSFQHVVNEFVQAIAYATGGFILNVRPSHHRSPPERVCGPYRGEPGPGTSSGGGPPPPSPAGTQSEGWTIGNLLGSQVTWGNFFSSPVFLIGAVMTAIVISRR